MAPVCAAPRTGALVSERSVIRVGFPGGSYEVVAGRGALEQAGRALSEVVGGRQVFLLSSPTVRTLHAPGVRHALAAARTVVELEVPDGEGAKSIEIAARLWREMVAAGGKRDSVLVALGGGSVGDLGGFVAGAFLRGIPFVQMPTTVLAQVDASVGGKTGIDLPEGKNTVGLFHQPALVVADTSWLETLPAGERRAGLLESVKMAFCLAPGLFERIEADLVPLLDGRHDVLAEVIAGSIAAKAGVVESDPFEADLRRVLNFGHTLAHAIETALGYDGLRHGEAVGWGMRFALALAEETFGQVGEAQRLCAVLDHFELPPLPALAPAHLLALIGRDKKATEAGVAWVLPRALGRAEMVRVEPWVVAQELERFLGR